jgi:TatA/E family protein of Tat protein translocase
MILMLSYQIDIGTVKHKEIAMWSHFALLDLSTPDLLIILAMVLLLFGSKKLPELSRSLGMSARELKKGLSDANVANEELQTHVSEATSGIQDTRLKR